MLIDHTSYLPFLQGFKLKVDVSVLISTRFCFWKRGLLYATESILVTRNRFSWGMQLVGGKFSLHLGKMTRPSWSFKFFLPHFPSRILNPGSTRSTQRARSFWRSLVVKVHGIRGTICETLKWSIIKCENLHKYVIDAVKGGPIEFFVRQFLWCSTQQQSNVAVVTYATNT